jgi:transcription elongation factor Elf1
MTKKTAKPTEKRNFTCPVCKEVHEAKTSFVYQALVKHLKERHEGKQ